MATAPTALAVVHPDGVATYRQSTDAASLCREIVIATASKIQGRDFVSVEGWQAIAVAHGCVASAIDVHRVTDEGACGFAATGVLRRMSDGVEIGRAEGFVGDDEKTWGKRDVYARRAMAQTRAISRVCRSAFAHVIVMMKAGLATTPEEEVPEGGFEEDAPKKREKMEGPHGTVAALREACRHIRSAFESAQDADELEAANDEHAETIAQVRRYKADWWEHPDYGLMHLLAERRTYFAGAGQSEPEAEAPKLEDGFQTESAKMLHEQMMQALTPEKLKEWRKTNDAMLKALSETDGRILFDAYQQRLGRLTADLTQAG